MALYFAQGRFKYYHGHCRCVRDAPTELQTMIENVSEMDESTYFKHVHELLSDDIHEWDVMHFHDHDGDHIDVVVCAESDVPQLLNDTETDMACIAWVVGEDEFTVLEGYGDLDYYDVSTHVETCDSLQEAVSVVRQVLY